MKPPVISVITPTWERHDFLMNRCMPSIAAQTYSNVEHVIVSDGPDDELAEKMFSLPIPHGQQRTFATLPKHAAGIVGGRTQARRYGIELAQGDLIAYLDDDDAFRPAHLQSLWQAINSEPDLDWVWSDMARHGRAEDVVGNDRPCYGHIGTPMVLHRRSLLEVANWGRVSDQEDWELFSQWIKGGARGKHLRLVTVDAWPEEWRDPGREGLSWLAGL